MKKFVLVFITCMAFLQVFSQENKPEYETIFTKKALKGTKNTRIYGIISGGYAPMWNSEGVAFHFPNYCVEAGVSVRKKYNLGVFTQSVGELPVSFRFTTDPDISTNIYENGISFGFTHRSQNAVHIVTNCKIGLLTVSELKIQDDDDFLQNSQSSVMIQPSVGLEANLFPWTAMTIMGGYRFVQSATGLGLDFGKNFRGPVVQLGFKFGNLR